MKITKATLSWICIPIGLFLLTFFWKFYFINSRDICIDEPYTIFYAQKSVSEIIKLSIQNENTPPLFMLLLHFWIKVFGISATSVRLIPLLFNALTSVFLFLSGKKISSAWTGILVSGLFIFSTSHFYFGLEARAYSLLSLAAAAALYYFLSLIRNPENRKLFIALIISNCILIYSNYFGLFLVGIQFLVSFTYFKNVKIFRKIILTSIFTGVLFLPLATVLIRQFLISAKGTWVQAPAKTEYLHQLWFFVNDKLVFNSIILIVIVGIIYILYSHKNLSLPKELYVIFAWWFIPYTFMFFISSKIPMFINSYILFNSIGFYLFISFVIAQLFSKLQFKVICSLLLLLMFSQIQINAKDFYFRDVQKAVKKVKNNITVTSIVVIYPHWDDLGFTYYYDNNIFKNYLHYDSLLLKNRIYNVWNLNMAKEYIEKNRNSRIIFYQGDKSEGDLIYTYLDTNYTKIDSSFFQQCYYITIFEGYKKNKVITTKFPEKTDFQKKVEGLKNYIKTDSKWLNAIKLKALEKKISVDSMLNIDAKWQVEQDMKK